MSHPGLYYGEPPIEGKPYQFLGSYILDFGKGVKPTMGFYAASDLVETVRTGRVPKMSHVKETTLLEYVIAYLQEEVDRRNYQENWNDADCVQEFIDMAYSAYAGGAR